MIDLKFRIFLQNCRSSVDCWLWPLTWELTRWRGRLTGIWLRIWPKIKLLGWKNTLNESCRELRALSNYHNYNISGWIDWSQISKYLSGPKLQTRISLSSLNQKRWGLGQKKGLDQGNNFHIVVPNFWDGLVTRTTSNTICIIQKITYVKIKSCQQESCRYRVDLPFHRRNFDLAQRARRDLRNTTSDLMDDDSKFFLHAWWKELRLIGMERYRRDLQQWLRPRRDWRWFCSSNERNTISLIRVSVERKE